MFTRVWACRNLCKLSKHILVTQRVTIPTRYSIIQIPQSNLHVKTYDKDAGLDTQRTANKFANLEEQENESIEPKGRRRRTSVSRTQRNLAQTSDEVNNELKSLNNEATQKNDTLETANVDPDVFGNNSKETLKEDEGKLQKSFKFSYTHTFL